MSRPFWAGAHDTFPMGEVTAAAVSFFSRRTLAAIVSGFVVYGLWRWLA